jgi:phosphatidylinositol glycan class O
VPGNVDNGCWHPKSFDKAVVIIVDALRFDFTVPFNGNETGQQEHHFHNAFPVLHETSVKEPQNAFLRPFIADPPTTTLLRLEGLTTGTLPTFIDAGSNFAGTAIDEDNLVEQLVKAGRKVVHLGDDTWEALFPGKFEPSLSKPFDSFNVWDLHTVDNGVNEHLFPLLDKSMDGRWDVIFGHYLGVDHAGHRYGPDHPAMADKLKQMDEVFRTMIERIDDDTLLVVMGDHGMDIKGDHGGESDDEIEAALWMYSKKGIFGRSDKAFVQPPATAKDRPVAQIDLVPTLGLLLGLPIPFNNLGQPIEEAFIGKAGNDYKNLAQVERLTAAQIHRYQTEYSKVRKLGELATSPLIPLWTTAQEAWTRIQEINKPSVQQWKTAYEAFSAYQTENLRICRSIWARFDLVSMGMGITILVGSLGVLAMFARGVMSDRGALTPLLLGWGLAGTILGGTIGAAAGIVPSLSFLQCVAFGSALGGVIGMSMGFYPARDALRVPYPRTFWGGLSALTCAMLCIGFASNSFTIWEDEQLLFFLTTFGVLMLASSLGLEDTDDRNMGAYNAISFIVATRLASVFRLCREEQMPFCRSTYYASATSSTSATWQLVIPFLVALTLPSAMQYFYHRTKNYQGSGVIWIGIALRIGLVFVALYWVVDAADDGDWYPSISKSLLKTTRVTLAQITLALSFAAGYATYIWASPLIAVIEEAAPPEPAPASLMESPDPSGGIFTSFAPPPKPRSKLIILGYANTHGTRYFLLPAAWLLALLLVQKPVGQGTLALCMISILNVLEIVDANNLRRSALGPTVLALLGSYYFFKTGHQAVLSTIQWETAFIPFKTIWYPFSPLVVILNTFGPQILCAIAVPAIPLWKTRPKYPGLLGRVAGAMATHMLFYAAIAVATVIEAAWLRRHLMLYRIFMPRMLMGVTVMMVVEIVAALVAVMGVRWSVTSVADIFGWE